MRSVITKKETIMRKIITWLIAGGTAVVATLGLMAAPSSASPGGLSPGALSEKGWGCIDAVHAVHCAPPGVAAKIPTTPVPLSEFPPTIPVLVFDTTDPQDTDAPFLGTEFNIRADLFHEQPCPTDPESRQYTFLPGPPTFFPLPYFACHRFNSPL
jgi:hypothetical protein